MSEKIVFYENYDNLNIHCYCFELKNMCYLYDYYFDVILRVSKKVKKCFELIIAGDVRFKKYKKELSYIQDLVGEGLLFGECTELSIVDDIAHISFAPIYSCNFRCKYCFGEHGDSYSGNEKVFSTEMMKDVLNTFIFKWFPKVKRYRIDFVSGGEPLLNFDLIRETILYVEEIQQKQSIDISVWLCTNGSLLNDDMCSFFDKHNVSIGISIDGEKENHDMCRVDINGKGTYDCVVEKIKTILNNEKFSKKFRNIWGLSVISENNFNILKIMEHNIGLGLNNIQMKLIRSENDNVNLDIINIEYELLCEKIYEEFINGRFNIIQSIANDNDYFGKILKRIFLHQVINRRCWAGVSKITVCPDGSVYPCDSFVGMSKFCMGLYSEIESIENMGINLNVDDRKKCRKCPVKYICGGDCYYNSYINSGNTNEPSDKFCKMQMHIINLCIALKLEMIEQNNILFKKIQKILFLKDEYMKKS